MGGLGGWFNATELLKLATTLVMFELADIRTEHLSKTYGKINAVDQVSFLVESGEFVVILGPSGSGKTTLLKCIAGLETPDEGNVFIDGEKVTSLAPRDRDISMVFQSYALFPLMTVRKNIGFPLTVKGEASDSVRRRVDEVGELLGISGKMEYLPKDLSGGEQQRVAIGRAIARKTKALLMDEPLSSLDAPLRAQLRTDLKNLQRELGLTIIYVTHDQVEAMALADRMGVMDRGALLQFGAPREIYDSPASSFVARFVGTPGANLIEVVVSRQGGSMVLRGPGIDLVPPNSLATSLKEMDGQRFTLAVRPEHVLLEHASQHVSFDATVELIEDLGATKILDLRVGQTQLKALVPVDFVSSPGSRVKARIDFEHARLYDLAEDSPFGI